MSIHNNHATNGQAVESLHDAESMSQKIVAEIHRRAGSRVRDLSVAANGERVIIRGTASSYYGWQLAIAACKTFSAGAESQVHCQLDVQKY